MSALTVNPATPKDLRDSRAILELARNLIKEDPHARKISSLETAGWLLITLLIGAAGFSLALTPHLWCWPLAFVVMALLQYHLLVATHEALHFGLFQSTWLNDLAGHLICWGQCIDLGAVRDHHNRHHRWYGFEEDPDRNEHHNFPSWIDSHTSAILLLLYNAIFITNLGGKIQRSHGKNRSLLPLLGIATTQSLLLGLFLVNGGSWWHYLLFYLAPLLLMSRSFNNIRMFAEHYGLQNPASCKQDQIFTARTTHDPRPWWRKPYASIERLVLAPYHFNYHFEHHLIPGLPYQTLPRLHRALRKAGLFDIHPHLVSPTYRQTLLSAYSRPSETRPIA